MRPRTSLIKVIAVIFFMTAALHTVTRDRADVAAAAPRASERAAQESRPFDQAAALAELRKRIAGREEKPASEVFVNIEMLKSVTAGRLLRVMEMGYSRSLGVNCTHCHTPGEWESDSKATKRIARDMMRMVSAINDDLLRKVPNLKSENPTVNCTTCHRRQTKPALNLPEN